MSKTTAIADTDLLALQNLASVRGIALGADHVITVLLDREDEATRREVTVWGQRRRKSVEIKVIGTLVL